MPRFFRLLSILAMLWAAPAAAGSDPGWIEARTDHFIIYVKDDEAAARAFATRLEAFDAALRRLYDVPDDPDRKANPVRIFALEPETYNDVCHCGGYAVGYYQGHAGTSSIFSMYVPKVDAKARPGDMTSQSVLLHEYGHHFMFSNFPMAFPVWYSEGFAEFNANVVFNADGSITIGLPANYRADPIRWKTVHMSPTEFLQPVQRYGGNGWETQVIYGRGWLLTHYLTLAPQRKGQLARYLDGLNRGASSVDAARAAFGNLDDLWDELTDYARDPLAKPLRVPPPAHKIEVKLTPLSPGAGAMMLSYARVVSGQDPRDMPRIAREAERVADDYPADPVVQSELALIEYVAKRSDSADAAADRALAADPANMLALVVKGRVAVRRAGETKATDPRAWSAARGWFLKANRADPNAAEPLLYYYTSFAAAKQEPTPGAVKGLSRAVVLAPEDGTVRSLLAIRLLVEKDGPGARALLAKLAYAPHARADRNKPLAAIELIDAGKLPEALALLTAKDKDEEAD